MAKIGGLQKDYIKAYEELGKLGINVSALLMLTKMSYDEKERLAEYKSDPSLKPDDYDKRINRCYEHLLSTFLKVDTASSIINNYRNLFAKFYLDNTDDDTNDYKDETMVKLNKIYNFINDNSDKDYTGSELLSEIRKEITNEENEPIANWYYDSIFQDLKIESDRIKEANLETKMGLVPKFLEDIADMESFLFRKKIFKDDYRKSVTGLTNYLLARAELPLIYIKPIELDEYYSYIETVTELYDNKGIVTFYKEKMCDSIENVLIIPMQNSITEYIEIKAKEEAGLLDNPIHTLKQNKYK